MGIAVKELITSFLMENVSTKLVNAEFEKIVTEAVPKIEHCLKNYKDCKIGKSGNIENRLDDAYRKAGFVDLIQITKCKSKEAMDKAEIFLIKHFKDHVENDTDLEVGNKTYSGDYWIYIVHKGEIKSDSEGKTK